jgi:hypothetical protein
VAGRAGLGETHGARQVAHALPAGQELAGDPVPRRVPETRQRGAVVVVVDFHCMNMHISQIR